MLSEFLALLGTFLFGLGTIFIRRGLMESNFLSGTVITTLVGTIAFWFLSLWLVPLNSFNLLGVLFFALAGLFIPGISRLSYFKGIETLGASLNTSIVSIQPIFSSLFAIFILGEHPSPGIWVGMICIICGVVLIERNMDGNPVKSSSIGGGGSGMALAFPVLAGILAGFGFVLRKIGLNVFNEPIGGVAIANLSALCLYAVFSSLWTSTRSSVSVDGRSIRLFWKAGLTMGGGHLCILYALRYGDVSIVTSLMNAQPFFVFLLAHIFLRELEKVTYKLILGTIIIVTGVTLITIF